VRTFTDLRGQRRPDADLPLFDAPATVRTFDAPEFRGITFYEVEAKSILNHVRQPHAVRVDHQRVSGLFPCLCLLYGWRHSDPDG
jgi:hypothetical protein